ncbi:putative siderophore iron transporter [Meredithblackwellia eburnea MCA 4105]
MQVAPHPEGSMEDMKAPIDHVEDSKPQTNTNDKLESLDSDVAGALAYTNVDEEPEIHWRTYVALLSMALANFTVNYAIQGSAAATTIVGADLKDTADQAWVPNVLSVMQAVFSPLFSFTSDTFQARKMLIIIPCTLATIGSCIVPGSTSMYRVFGGQILIGFGMASIGLIYAIPSEIVPRRWRPAIQAMNNIAAGLAGIAATLLVGGLTKRNAHTGWRYFFWSQVGMWGLTVVGIAIGYRPPPRHSRLDGLTMAEKIKRLDLPGMSLLTIGLTLLLAGIQLGGKWGWTNTRCLVPLVIGCVTFVGFFVYEWLGTSTGILDHRLFRHGRAFPILILLMMIEGIVLFSVTIFYPQITGRLFEHDPLMLLVREEPFFGVATVACFIFGWWSTKAKTIKWPMMVGYACMVAGIACFATMTPSDNKAILAYISLVGLGLGAPLILIIAGVQLSTPHSLIATSTAVVATSRAVGASIFTSIYTSAATDSLGKKTPAYIAEAGLKAGLPPSSLGAFIGVIAASKPFSVASAVPGVTAEVYAAGMTAYHQAIAQGYRVVYYICLPFAVIGLILCFFLPDFTSLMNFRVDAPVEELHARHKEKDSVPA